MTCTFCGETGHNRRTCQQWSLIEATRREGEIIRNENIRRENDMIYNSTPPITPPPHSPPGAPRRGGEGRVNRVVTIHHDNNPSGILTLINEAANIETERNLLREFDIATLTTYHENKILVTQCEQPFEATDCGICMEELKQTNKFVTRCGHQFCGCCMIRHMRTQDFCPSCRGVLG